MEREIKFRAWSNKFNKMCYQGIDGCEIYVHSHSVWFDGRDDETAELMQYTGLKDKSGIGDICFYEGDIINLQGELIGNKYEEPDLLKDATNLLIEGLGTKAWRDTEQEAIKRGLGYAK